MVDEAIVPIVEYAVMHKAACDAATIDVTLKLGLGKTSCCASCDLRLGPAIGKRFGTLEPGGTLVVLLR